jgi:bisphosphoglycerate-independent phosphoglycerate mutase (AlkP superfamily)
LINKRGPLALIIIDGWGYSSARDGNAIALAETPFYDELCEKYPQTLLEAHGSRVGLPAGVMGNSEVGHLNIGSGRVIRMDVSLVDHEVDTGTFFQNKALTAVLEGARDRGKALHVLGLCSDGQVHSSLTHGPLRPRGVVFRNAHRPAAVSCDGSGLLARDAAHGALAKTILDSSGLSPGCGAHRAAPS